MNTIFNQCLAIQLAKKTAGGKVFLKWCFSRVKKTKFHKQLLSNFQAEIRKSAKQLKAELKIGVAYIKKCILRSSPAPSN